MTFEELYADLKKQTTPEEQAATFKLIQARLELFPEDPQGLTVLGSAYYFGLGTPKDYKKAFELFTKAAKANYYLALINLAVMYKNGLGTEVNIPLAIQNANNAAKMPEDKKTREAFNILVNLANENPENIDANSALGWHYATNKIVDLDYAKSFFYYERAAKAGGGKSLFNLGHLYENGLGVKKDIAKACQYYSRAAQAGVKEALTRCEEIDDPEAYFTLGLYYHNQLDQIEKAKTYFSKGIEKEHVKCLISLANLTSDAAKKADIFWKGLQFRSPQSIEVFAVLDTFCETHPNIPETLYTRGYAYKEKRGVTETNLAAAARDFKKAMELNHAPAIPQLAACYITQLINDDEAMRLVYEAEKKKFPIVYSPSFLWMFVVNANTRYELGAIYALRGDYNNAIKMFKDSYHDERSLCHLGKMLEQGLGFKKDLNQAVIFYVAAAQRNGKREEGSACAVAHLKELPDRVPYIECLEFGWGIAANPQLASEHYDEEIQKLYKRISDNEFNAQTLPSNLIELLKLNRALFKCDLKVVKDAKLISILNKLLSSEAKTFLAENSQLRAELLELSKNSIEAKRVLEHLDRYQVVQHYLQQIRLCMTDMKTEIENKIANKEWQKRYGFLWVHGLPAGVEQIQKILNLNPTDDLALLQSYVDIEQLLAQKNEDNKGRHPSTTSFYSNWQAVFSAMNLTVEYAKLWVPKVNTTAKLQSILYFNREPANLSLIQAPVTLPPVVTTVSQPIKEQVDLITFPAVPKEAPQQEQPIVSTATGTTTIVRQCVPG